MPWNASWVNIDWLGMFILVNKKKNKVHYFKILLKENVAYVNKC